MIREVIGDGVSWGLGASLIIMLCVSGGHLGYRIVEMALTGTVR